MTLSHWISFYFSTHWILSLPSWYQKMPSNHPSIYKFKTNKLLHVHLWLISSYSLCLSFPLCSMCSSQRTMGLGQFMKSWLREWLLTWRAMSKQLSRMCWRFASILLLTLNYSLNTWTGLTYFSLFWLQFSWFFFELIVKSMAQHLVDYDKLKVKY